MQQYQDNFIALFACYIEDEIKARGFGNGPAILAQAILESGWGKSNLAKKHNYFGIKAPSSYKGETQNGFMIYFSRENGVAGYFDLISKPRYAGLKGIYGYEPYIDELIRSGYCEDEGYKESLMELIEKYGLYHWFYGVTTVTFELIEKVINGDYGNGEERHKRLLREGYDTLTIPYIQSLVNCYLKHEPQIVHCFDRYQEIMTEVAPLLDGLSDFEIAAFKDLFNMKAAQAWEELIKQ